MRITNKLNRPTSIISAICLLVALVLSLIGTLLSSASSPYPIGMSTLLWTTLSFIATLLVIIALFRGKKDIFSAVVFILAAFQTTAALFDAFSLAKYMEYWSDLTKLSQYCGWFASLTNLAFRILVVVECFKPGALSGGTRRLLLIFLPIIWVLLGSFGQCLQSLSYGFRDPAEAFLRAFPTVFIQMLLNAPWIIIGITFSIPVREPVRPPVPQPPFIPGVPPVFPPHF